MQVRHGAEDIAVGSVHKNFVGMLHSQLCKHLVMHLLGYVDK